MLGFSVLRKTIAHQIIWTACYENMIILFVILFVKFKSILFKYNILSQKYDWKHEQLTVQIRTWEQMSGEFTKAWHTNQWTHIFSIEGLRWPRLGVGYIK